MIKKITSTFLLIGTFFVIGGGALFPQLAVAAAITSARDTMTRLKTSTTADHSLTWTLPTGVDFDLNDELRVDFPHSSGFTESGTWAAADFTFNDGTARTISAVEDTASPNGAVAGCVDGANNVGIEMDSTNLVFAIIPCGASYVSSAAAAAITFTIDGTTADGTLTNPSGAGQYIITISNDEANNGSDDDTVSIAIRIIADDQVVVTATVDPTFTFSLGGNSVALGTLSTGSPSSGSHTVSASTNGAGGFTVSYNGAALTSGGNTITPIGGTAAASSAGSEQFGINLRDNTTPNVGANVTQNSGTCGYGAQYGTADSFAYVASTTTTVTSVTAPADCVYTVSYMANISATTEAGSYSTTIDYIGTGTF
jgi:hypothetical protein